MDQADPPFPRPTAHWWFGCKNSPSQFSGNIIEKERHDDGVDGIFDAG